MPCWAHRSASQYQVKIHSMATTRSWRKGSMAFRKASGQARRLRCSSTSPARRGTQLHPAGMQVDATVVGVGFGVESHQVPPCGNWTLPGAYPIRMLPGGGLNEYHAVGSGLAGDIDRGRALRRPAAQPLLVPQGPPPVVEDTVNQTRKVSRLKRPGFRVAPWGTPGAADAI